MRDGDHPNAGSIAEHGISDMCRKIYRSAAERGISWRRLGGSYGNYSRK